MGQSIEAQYDLRHAVDHRDARDTILRDLMQRYLDDVVPRQKGREAAASRCKFIMRQSITAYSLANLTRAALVVRRDHRLLSVSGSTVRKEELLMLRAAFDHGRKELGLYLAENPVALIRLPDENEARERRLAPGEEAALLTGAVRLRHPTSNTSLCSP